MKGYERDWILQTTMGTPKTYIFRGFYGKQPGFEVAKTFIFSWFWGLVVGGGFLHTFLFFNPILWGNDPS